MNMYNDQGPSEDDIDRFSQDETGYCPHCNEEIWDDAAKCPACGNWLHDGTRHEDQAVRYFKNKFVVCIVIALLLGFFWSVTRLF
ncbi:MAG: zinc ribbon domain-containing protein [Phycisphaerae bacterium]|nr:zinc ribbon domain-containing protein [Phycisphaerae bacterium]MBT5409059.1 zinc ribbon domain-containing protein [Phycisphaerae bacterium]MBT6164400.1 zinc ribbon domain-containing protein [Phycisphaerae bacterium]MBT7657880.1 zinc ribbon domain-containing protein [Phycisphaerae bacterium]